MNIPNGQSRKSFPLNPLKWRALTWLVFVPWLAFGIFANCPTFIGDLNGGERTLQIGWPFPHTELLYPAGSVSAVRKDVSIIVAIIDLLLLGLVQVSIVAVMQRWRLAFSLRALFLLTALAAILLVIGKNEVVAEQVLVVVACIYFVYYSPVAAWLCMLVAGKARFSPSTEKLLTIAVVLALLVLGTSLTWEYIPGTYHTDRNGFPRGTGKATYYYDSGALQLVASYRAGLLTESTWYRPDGTHIATSVFAKQTGGIWLYLREDGSIKSKTQCRYSPSDEMYIGDGTTIYYAPDGTIEKAVEYRDRVSGD